MGDARSKLNGMWQAGVLPFYASAVADRYPVNANAADEITMQDFGRFFGPSGVMDRFFDDHLKPFVDTSSRTWKWKPGVAPPAGVTSGSLRSFQKAAQIRDAFFTTGTQEPLVRFSLKPVYLDASVSKFLLDLDGQKFSYRHGPAVAREGQWPGRGVGSVRVVFEDASKKQYSLTKDGPWAWFQLLDESDKEQVSADRMIVTFEVKGHKARYEVRAASVVNAFSMKELQGFRVPGRL